MTSLKQVSSLFLTLSLLLPFSAACTPASPNPTQTSSPEPTASPVDTSPPAETPTFAPDQTATPTPVWSNWQTFSKRIKKILKLTLPGWQPGEDGAYQGPDGFFRAAYLPEMAFMNGTYRVCERLANTPQGPAWMVQWTAIPQADACLMTPYPEMSTNNAQAVVENPAGDPEHRYFYLEADTQHIEMIFSSLELLNPVTQRQPFPSPTGPLRPEDQVFWQGTSPLPQELTLEEHPVVAASVDSPTHVEFNDRIPDEILQKRAAWRNPSPEAKLEQQNALLEPFGYRLQPNRVRSDFELYDLYQGDQELQKDIDAFWPVSVSASGGDFALVVEVLNDGYRLVGNDRLINWDMSTSLFTAPVFYGEDLLTLRWDPERSQVQVQRDDETIFSFVAAFLVSSPAKGFWSWDGHWLLEVDGFLVQDGQILNGALGDEEIFGWQLLNGKPFYYFRHGPRIGLSYDGQMLPIYYDDVVHYRCCEPGAFNTAGNEHMVWFYALRDGIWYYVELGAYQ